MHDTSRGKPCCRGWIYFIGILGSFLIIAGLARVMYNRTRPPAPNLNRAQERATALRDINAASADALQNYGWVDQAKGLVRLPVRRAMEITVREWQNPAAARSNLISRVDKATAPVPEKKSEFE